jgi:hypothetical protein
MLKERSEGEWAVAMRDEAVNVYMYIYIYNE